MATMSSSRAKSFVVGIFGVVVVAAVVFVAATASSGLPVLPTTPVAIEFTNVGQLSVGDDVRENSKRIGQVSALGTENGAALVTVELDGHVPVYADARAAIWDQSALGQKFVELSRGTPAAGPLKGAIPASRNTNSADIDQLLDVFDSPTRDALTSAIRQLGGGVAGHSADLHQLLEHSPAILDDLSKLTSALSSRQANLPGLLDSVDSLAGSFNGHEQELSQLVQQLGGTLDAVNVDNGQPLQNTLKDLPGTLTQVRQSFNGLSQPLTDTQAALTGLEPGIASLGQATPDLRGVLREGVPPLNLVPGVAKTAGPAVDGLTTAITDARPLAPRLSEALVNLSVPLAVLASYTPDIGNFFDRVNSLVSEATAPGQHVARLGVAVEGLGTVSGGVIKDPLLGRNPYAPPGQADRDRATPLIPGVTGGN